MATPEFTTEELATEEWRDVDGFGQVTPTFNYRYQVSNLGRVRTVTIRILKAGPWGEYLRITLFRGKQAVRNFKSFGVHQLIAKVFIGPRPNGQIVNHKDTKKRNNRLTNLEYRTHQGNAQHASENGLLLTGEANGQSRLTDKDVERIIERLATGESCKKICRDYPVTDRVVSLIRQNRAWKHILRPASPYLGRVANGQTLGEDAFNAKITEADVIAIRSQHDKGYGLKAIVASSGLAKSQVWRIITRKSWKHVV